MSVSVEGVGVSCVFKADRFIFLNISRQRWQKSGKIDGCAGLSGRVFSIEHTKNKINGNRLEKSGIKSSQSAAILNIRPFKHYLER